MFFISANLRKIWGKTKQSAEFSRKNSGSGRREFGETDHQNAPCINIRTATSSSPLPTPSIEVMAIAQKLGQDNLALTQSAFFIVKRK